MHIDSSLINFKIITNYMFKAKQYDNNTKSQLSHTTLLLQDKIFRKDK